MTTTATSSSSTIEYIANSPLFIMTEVNYGNMSTSSTTSSTAALSFSNKILSLKDSKFDTFGTTVSSTTSSTISQLPIYTVNELNYGLPTSSPTLPPAALYRANVELPIIVLNLDLPKNATKFLRCPHSNITTSTFNSTTNTYTNNLTNFGNFLLNFVIQEFNTKYGYNFSSDDFAIMSIPTDQNAKCSYEIFSNVLNININVWTQISYRTTISLNFIDAVD